VLTNSEGITLPVVAADGSAVRDVTVTSDTAQDGDVLKTTGRNTSYTKVTALNGTSG
jgi:pectate lyase